MEQKITETIRRIIKTIMVVDFMVLGNEYLKKTITLFSKIGKLWIEKAVLVTSRQGYF